MLTISWPILLSSPQAPTHSLNRPAGHIPLCLVQHDDRSEAELLTERSLIDLNQAVCARDSGCRYVFTRQHFDPTVEPHWQKLFAVRAALDTGCQHAVWLDSDVVVHASRPTRLLDSFAGRAAFVNADPPADLTPRFFRGQYADHPTASMNAGIWGIANTPSGRGLLDAWIGLYPAHLWTVERHGGKSPGSVRTTGCVVTRPGGPDSPRRFRALAALFSGAGGSGRRAPSATTTAFAAAAPPADDAKIVSDDENAAAAATATAASTASASSSSASSSNVVLDAKSPAERALAATEARMVAQRASMMHAEALAAQEEIIPAVHIGCEEGVANYVSTPYEPNPQPNPLPTPYFFRLPPPPLPFLLTPPAPSPLFLLLPTGLPREVDVLRLRRVRHLGQLRRVRAGLVCDPPPPQPQVDVAHYDGRRADAQCAVRDARRRRGAQRVGVPLPRRV